MERILLLGTSSGLSVCERQGDDWQEVRRGLADKSITSVIARQGVILVGTPDGIYRSDDTGSTWVEASHGLTVRHVRWMAFHPDVSDFELAGTEPAGIFVSRDGGGSWRLCPEVEALRQRFNWYLPYSPEAGCVRGFSHHGDRAYAAVEVGGVLVSQDGGEQWQLAEGSRGDTHSAPPPFIHPDVHSIETHSSSAELVYAPTGGGFFRSLDSGVSWKLSYRCYCRAVWIDSADAEHIILGPADSVDRNGRIEESRDGGATWQAASYGLEIPWPRHMVERFMQVGDDLLAVLSNGELLSAPLDGLSWRRILSHMPAVAAVAYTES